jgi:aminoglycoside phosphotransferase
MESDLVADPAGCLRELLGAVEFETAPTRLSGGPSAWLYEFRLRSGPPALLNHGLVWRVLREQSGSIQECVIQREAARLGFPTPAVLANGLIDGVRPYLIMEKVDGKSLFDALGPIGATRHAPARLAGLMARLHQIDAAEVVEVVRREEIRDELDVVSRALRDVDESFEAIDAPWVADLRRWLEANRPPAGRTVVCHGDLHALNVMVCGDDDVVLDWELAGVGEPAFDVARTELILAAVPMEVPRVVRPVIQRFGRRAAEGFVAAYTRQSHLEVASLEWYGGLHCARLLGRIITQPPGDPVVDGWRPTVGILCSSLRGWTGVNVRTPVR